MSFPFLKNQIKSAGSSNLIVKTRESDEKDPQTDPMSAVASDLIDAIHARDIKKVAQVLKDAQEIADMEPHVEGPHLDEESES